MPRKSGARKVHTRRNHDYQKSKDFPSCFDCNAGGRKCSATDNSGKYPCDRCVKKGIENCMPHQKHPDWIPGKSGRTKKRNNTNAGQRYHNMISKHTGKATKKRDSSEDEDSDFSPPSSTSGPLRRSARSLGKQIDYAALADEDEEVTDGSASENIEESETLGGDSGADGDDEGASPDTNDGTNDIDMPDATTESTSGVWIGGYHWDFEPGFMDD